VLVIVGPSGAGKSTLAAELQRLGVVRVQPTWTTRPPRPDEAGEPIGHRFVTDPVFDRLDEQGFFVDVARPFGLAHRYGLPALPPGSPGPVDAVLARASYVPRLAQHAGGGLVVYQVEASGAIVAERLARRGTSAAESAARRAHDGPDVQVGRRLATRVLHNDGTVAALVTQALTALAADVPTTAASSLAGTGGADVPTLASALAGTGGADVPTLASALAGTCGAPAPTPAGTGTGAGSTGGGPAPSPAGTRDSTGERGRAA
jgi:guanylate kinase